MKSDYTWAGCESAIEARAAIDMRTVRPHKAKLTAKLTQLADECGKFGIIAETMPIGTCSDGFVVCL
jgi:hypothetical protein